MTDKELVNKYHINLKGNYRKKHIRMALEIISCSTYAHGDDCEYTLGPNFQPHTWVVGAVCEALANKDFWKNV